jgi:hypothetical protein
LTAVEFVFSITPCLGHIGLQVRQAHFGVADHVVGFQAAKIQGRTDIHHLQIDME